MAKDFAEVLNDKGSAGRAIVGPTSPTGIAKVMRTDLADFAIVPFDTLAVGVKSAPDWPERVPIVARLAPETIEIIAPKDVKSIGDLQGKVVSFGDPDSATGVTARLLFSRLGVTVNPTYEPLTEALDALSTGKRGAVVVLGAKEAQALDGFGADGRYHVVAVPWAPALEQVYAPARVAAADRPNLVAANDSVETVAEPMALIALDAAAGSPRADALGGTARVFFDNYDAFLSDRARQSLARRQSRRGPVRAEHGLAAACGGARMARRTQNLGRRLARRVSRVGENGGRRRGRTESRRFRSAL